MSEAPCVFIDQEARDSVQLVSPFLPNDLHSYNRFGKEGIVYYTASTDENSNSVN